MITGFVTAKDEAIVSLTLSNEDGETAAIECVIDTGFTDYLALTRRVIRELSLPQTGEEEVILADGSLATLAFYTVRLDWDGEERDVSAYAVDGVSLLGMKLLRGCLLTMEIAEDGLVTIESID